jgi:hypothetical protein
MFYFVSSLRFRPMSQTKAPGSGKGFTPLGIIFAVLGLALFTYFVKKAGVAQVADGIRRLGAGFLLIIAISSVRQIVRSFAWCLCVESPYRLRFWDAFRARTMGDAIGNVLPFASFVISEPAKPALIRDRLPLMAGLSSITIENIFYSLSVAVFISSGMIALLLSFSLPKGLQVGSFIVLGVILIVITLGTLLIRKEVRFISGTAGFLHRRGLSDKWIEKGRTMEDRIYGFYRRNRARFIPILVLEACFHLAGVAEIYVVLIFISPQQPPTFLTAFIAHGCRRSGHGESFESTAIHGSHRSDPGHRAQGTRCFLGSGGDGASSATRPVITHCGARSRGGARRRSKSGIGADLTAIGNLRLDSEPSRRRRFSKVVIG